MPDAFRSWIYLHNCGLWKKLSSVGRMMGQTGTHGYHQVALCKGFARGRMRKTSGDPEEAWIAFEQSTHRKCRCQQAVASFRQLFAKRFGTGQLSAAPSDNDD